MNLSLSMISVSSKYFVSPFVCGTRLVTMKSCNFLKVTNSIGWVINSCFYQCNFRQILNRAIVIGSNNYNQLYLSRSVLSSSSDNVFNDCIFANCTSSARGGAVYVEFSTAIVNFTQCGFISCYSSKGNDYSSGGLSAINGICISLKKTCFFLCANINDPPSFQISAHSGVKGAILEYVSELNAGDPTRASCFGSMCGGSEIFVFAYNNITDSKSNGGRLGGITMTKCTQSSILQEFCTISLCTGNGFISFFNQDSGTKYLKNCNYLNNTPSNHWITFESASTKPSFENCVFIGNKDLVICPNTNLVFSNCYFSSDLQSSNRRGTFNGINVFEADFNNLNFIIHMKTYYCWARGSSLNLPTQIQRYYRLTISILATVLITILS